jgi:hypothetical protein
VCGVLDNILHLSPLWLLGTAVLPVFLEDAIFIGFLVPGVTAAVLAGVGASLVFNYSEDWSVRVGPTRTPRQGGTLKPHFSK